MSCLLCCCRLRGSRKEEGCLGVWSSVEQRASFGCVTWLPDPFLRTRFTVLSPCNCCSNCDNSGSLGDELPATVSPGSGKDRDFHRRLEAIGEASTRGAELYPLVAMATEGALALPCFLPRPLLPGKRALGPLWLVLCDGAGLAGDVVCLSASTAFCLRLMCSPAFCS